MEYKPQVFTAPKAYIKIGNAVAGMLRNLTWSENITRGTVRGLGSLVNQEAPALAIDCQFTADQFFIDLNNPSLKEMLNREMSVSQFCDSLILGTQPFSIVIYEKEINEQDKVNKIVTSINIDGKTIANLSPCYINSQNFTLSEQSVAGANVSGVYLNPITTLT